APRPPLFPYTTLFRSLVLRGVAAHLEDDLAVAVRRRRRLLGNVRTDDDLRQPLLVTQRAHAVRPSRILAAGTVMTTRSAATRLTGSTELASTTPTFGTLRAASQRFMSKPSTTTSPFVTPKSASFATNSFVFGALTAKVSVSTSRSWRTSSERIERSAPRYIL